MSQSNFGDLMRQVTRMRKDMEKTQEELKNRFVDAQAGGGLVEVTLNCQQELVKLSIAPKLFEPGPDGKVDPAMVEDLVIAAMAQGLEKSKALMREELEKVTGGLGLGNLLPGLF